jgi:MoaA/NifB/PqqE/SkfB family radical SAM enzyme
MRVVIRLTQRCDMACPYCLVSAANLPPELDFAAWQRILASLSQISTRKVLLTGGEPLLYPDLISLVAFISGMGIPVDLNSNLQQMTYARMQSLRSTGLTEISTAIEGRSTVHDRIRGRSGAFARTRQAIEWAAKLGIQVDASCCLQPGNLEQLDELLDLLQDWPIQSFTVSRLFPIGHGACTPQPALSQADLDAAYSHLVDFWLPRSRFPIRLVGLLGYPLPIHCQRGSSLIGLTPNGQIQACVLNDDYPSNLPTPQDIGLYAAVTVLRGRLKQQHYRLCCEVIE